MDSLHSSYASPKVVAACCLVLLGLHTGCMRGMTYKMPMPESLTIGTIKGDEESAIASSQSRGNRPISIPAATPVSDESRTVRPAGLPRSSTKGPTDIAIVSTP